MGQVTEIVVAGNPVAKERPRAARNGHFYTPAATKEYEERVAWTVRASGQSFPTEDVRVALGFYCKGRKRPDLDNLVKAALDGAEKGGLFGNDKQVVQVLATRSDNAAEPRTTIFVAEVFWVGGQPFVRP